MVDLPLRNFQMINDGKLLHIQYSKLILLTKFHLNPTKQDLHFNAFDLMILLIDGQNELIHVFIADFQFLDVLSKTVGFGWDF
jgi:hypothetical protein